MSEIRAAFWRKFDERGEEGVRQDIAMGIYGDDRLKAAREWFEHQASVRLSEDARNILTEAKSANDLARDANSAALEANAIARRAENSAERSAAAARTANVIAIASAVAAIIAIVVSIIGLSRK